MAGDDDDETDDALLPGLEQPNAGDPKQVAQANKAHRFKKGQEADFIQRKLLADPVGRRIIWDWLMDLGTFETRFAAAPAGVPDQFASWWHFGRQQWGYQLYKTLLKIDRLAVCTMHDENDPQFQKPKPKRVTRNENG